MCSEGFPIEIKITNVTFQTNQSTHMYVEMFELYDFGIDNRLSILGEVFI